MKKHLVFLVTIIPLLVGPVHSDTVYVDSNAGIWEKKAADDLAHYLGLMLGVPISVSNQLTPSQSQTQFVVGQMALRENPTLRDKLEAVAKPHPVIRADAIAISRGKGRIYLAGSNDDSHYFAVSAFLHKQGCRWYFPTAFGECIPKRGKLDLEGIETSYSPPFEVRTYWLSYNGDPQDYENFARRNFFNLDRSVACNHNLDNLLPADQPILSTASVKFVADKLEQAQRADKTASLSINDRLQNLALESEKQLSGGFYDKYFYGLCSSDVFIAFYNNVCEELWRRNPNSKSKFGFLAYTNLTLPPQRAIEAAEPLIAFLAPIDIDPNHAFNDRRSPPKQDYLGALRRWTKVMNGRVIIYDYDQSMLVWRDIPNPSHHVMKHDIQEYKKQGILGFLTESRNSIATTFTNLFFRGQLYWDPNFNVESELVLFYKNFYGVNSTPMGDYWSRIHRAWESTVAIEHEYYIASGIYSMELVEQLRPSIRAIVGEDSRTKFTKLSFEVLENYVSMISSAGRDCDYQMASEFGRRGLAARDKLTEMSGTFTTYKKIPEKGPAWWPGEVEQYQELSKFRLLEKTPLKWDFKIDPHDEGCWQGWGDAGGLPGGQPLRTDVLPRLQGVHDSSYHGWEGYGWYSCRLELAPGNYGQAQVVFPGVFNSTWLYINGELVDWRFQKPPWWLQDYAFTWVAKSGGALRPGQNVITLRTEMRSLHPSGMFRRPFISQ